MRIIDLFCGIGGLSLGFEQSGFEVVAGVDLWEDAIKTFNHNRKDKTGMVMPVDVFNKAELPKILENGHITGVIGGPPCQGFSTVGKRDINDERNKLYLDFYETVKIAKPDFFVIENVKGMLTLNKGSFVKSVIDLFGENGLGYKVAYKLLNAADYGVPQNRYRVFYIGLRKDVFKFPDEKQFKVSCKEAIEDLRLADSSVYPSLPSSEYQRKMRGDNNILLNQDITSHSDKTISIISQIPDGGNIRCLPREYWEVRKYNKAFERMGSNRQSNTVDTGHRNYFHYKENRIPTVRENARLQSFPDNFEFLGTRGSQYKQVGNAVPPMLSYEIAQEILKQL